LAPVERWNGRKIAILSLAKTEKSDKLLDKVSWESLTRPLAVGFGSIARVAASG